MLQKFWQKILAILFPVYCLGCKTPGVWLCPTCTAKIQRSKTQCCPVCRGVNLDGSTCEKCQGVTPLSGLLVAAQYSEQEILARLIKKLKYGLNTELVTILGELLAQTLSQQKISPQDCLLAFVPLYKSRELERGFNQAELLAKTVSMKTGLPFLDLLIRIRNTPNQAQLPRRERLKNVRGAFAVKKQLPAELLNKKIIIVDDVSTTTATIGECARTLKKAGCQAVWGLVLARGS